jgi:hypothetical protein
MENRWDSHDLQITLSFYELHAENTQLNQGNIIDGACTLACGR